MQLAIAVEETRLLYQRWKKERYCRELVQQAAETRMLRQNEEMAERQLDEKLLQEVIEREIIREQR